MFSTFNSTSFLLFIQGGSIFYFSTRSHKLCSWFYIVKMCLCFGPFLWNFEKCVKSLSVFLIRDTLESVCYLLSERLSISALCDKDRVYSNLQFSPQFIHFSSMSGVRSPLISLPITKFSSPPLGLFRNLESMVPIGGALSSPASVRCASLLPKIYMF